MRWIKRALLRLPRCVHWVGRAALLSRLPYGLVAHEQQPGRKKALDLASFGARRLSRHVVPKAGGTSVPTARCVANHLMRSWFG